jgi:hypothetical protein
MGAQDSLEQAGGFVADTGTATPLMIWDTGFDSWIHYGVSGQPTAILVDATGQPIQGWRGVIDTDEVLRLAAEA